MNKQTSKEKILLYQNQLSSIRAKNRLPELKTVRKQSIPQLDKSEFLLDLKIFNSPQSNLGLIRNTPRLTPQNFKQLIKACKLVGHKSETNRKTDFLQEFKLKQMQGKQTKSYDVDFMLTRVIRSNNLMDQSAVLPDEISVLNQKCNTQGDNLKTNRQSQIYKNTLSKDLESKQQYSQKYFWSESGRQPNSQGRKLTLDFKEPQITRIEHQIKTDRLLFRSSLPVLNYPEY